MTEAHVHAYLAGKRFFQQDAIIYILVTVDVLEG